MDVSLYEFRCQKALYQALQLAKALGHGALEVEHVASVLLKSNLISLAPQKHDYLIKKLDHFLSLSPKVFGTYRIDFGLRMNAALDRAEKMRGSDLVSLELLWSSLITQSSMLKLHSERDHDDESEAEHKPSTSPDRNRDQHPKNSPLKGKQKTENDTQIKSPLQKFGAVKKNPKVRHVETTKSSADFISDPQFEDYDDQVARHHQDAVTENTRKDQKTDGPKKGKTLPKDLQQVLEQFCIDLSSQADAQELDPVIGRDAELRRAIEILGRKKKNNPILIGDPGVGKSAIAEALAIKISRGEVPESLRAKRILSLDLGSLIAGAKFRGEFEDRLKRLLQALQASKGQIILFIDEIHMLVGAGGQEGSADAANFLKPALARGELHCMGATTLAEYRRYIERDAALNRRFQPVMVKEPSPEMTLAILRGLKQNYEIFHGVRIDDEALRTAVDLSVRYITDRTLPDKAIDLIDEAASKLRLEIESVPAVMDELRGDIERLEIERRSITPTPKNQAALIHIDTRLKASHHDYQQIDAIWRQYQELLEEVRADELRIKELEGLYDSAKSRNDFEFAAKLQHAEIPKLVTLGKAAQDKLLALQNQYTFLRQQVGAHDIAAIVSTWTGIPVGKMVKKDRDKLKDMEQNLQKTVFGQPEAIRKIVKSVQRNRIGVGDPNRPMGVFLFIGPTGVGKTETAKALAKELFNTEQQLIRVDMSEFMEKHSVARLVGSPPGYVGYGEGGQFAETVLRKKYCVILFDEIEKAHPEVLDILLQIFDDGRLTDGQGRLIDFKNTLMIMTSNLKIARPSQQEGRFLVDAAEKNHYDENLRQQLSQHLRPELVGRIDEVILFEDLDQRTLDHMLERYLQELNLRLSQRQLRVGLGSTLYHTLMVQGAGSSIGGRALRRAFQNLVIDPLSERLLLHDDEMRGAWIVDLSTTGQFVWKLEFEPRRYLPAASSDR